MIRLFFLIISCLYFSVLLTAQAADVRDLYQASISVPDQSTKTREQAIEQALLIVLGKVSGNTTIASVPQVQMRLSEASHLVEQYRYQPSQTTPLGATGLQLTVQFDKICCESILIRYRSSDLGNQSSTYCSVDCII